VLAFGATKRRQTGRIDGSGRAGDNGSMGRSAQREGDLFPLLRATRSAAGWTFDVEVPADSRYFEGHFDGEPVLPGVAQLALVLQLYRGVTADYVELREASVLRFRRRILPGDRLQATISRPDERGRSRFALRRGADAVSKGIVAWGEEPEG
jgi:hypothetical protein